MVKTFVRSILLSERERDFDELLALRVVTFLMDNHEAIFNPPQHIAVLVHRKLNQPKKVKFEMQSIYLNYYIIDYLGENFNTQSGFLSSSESEYL